MRVGLIGTGRMGTAIALRLMEGGHAVAVHNRTTANARTALEAGATWVADTIEPPGLVRRSLDGAAGRPGGA